MPAAQKLILHNGQSPGDILVMTAAIESLHRLYPGKYLTEVDSPVPAIFENNPHVAPVGKGKRIEMHYPLIHQSDQRQVHFMQGYSDYLGEVLGVPLPLQVQRPFLYLSEEEKTPMIEGSYWLINAGVKRDFTAKQYPHYQRVVDLLRGKVRFVQIGEAHHLHKPLEGVDNLIGKTTTRELLRLAYHSQGGVGPSTFLQHVCAALEKPYVCLLGGREPFAWVDYPTQTTLHTLGKLDCCKDKACWRSRAVPLGDGDKQDTNLCVQPRGTVGACMDMIDPEAVAEAIQ